MISKILRSYYCSTALILCIFNNHVLAGQTTRVSVSSNGTQANANSSDLDISSNGRFVTYRSRASNLIIGDTNKKEDCFIHDSLTKQTTRINDEVGKLVKTALPCEININNRYMVFMSQANNLVPNDTNRSYDVFLYDSRTQRITRISVASDGTQGNNHSILGYSLSKNSRYVAFASEASNLVSGDTNNTRDIFVHDTVTHKTERVSISSNGQQQTTNGSSYAPQISADGRYVAFLSSAYNLVEGDTNANWDVFVHDRLTHKTKRVSVASDGKQGSYYPNVSGVSDYSFSANGRYIAFSADFNNLVTDDSNNVDDIFVHDLLTGKTERVSVGINGAWQNTSDAHRPVISADGRYVAFLTLANKSWLPGELNYNTDIFIHDRLTHKTERVEVSLLGLPGNSTGYQIPYFSLSADGRYVAFSSTSSNLVIGDTNNKVDIFVRDRLLDTTHRADLTIAATKKPATVKPNSQNTYVYTITNNGKDTVPDVSLIHLVIDGSAIRFKPSQGKCSVSSVETVCHLGKLAAGKKLTLSVTVTAQSKTLNQQLTINGAPVDTKPGNNQISVITKVK